MSAATVECRRSVTVARPPADSSCAPSETCSSDVPRDGNNCRASIADSNQGLALRAQTLGILDAGRYSSSRLLPHPASFTNETPAK